MSRRSIVIAGSKQAKVAASVDEYLARLDEPERKALARLRAQIRQAAPKATESPVALSCLVSSKRLTALGPMCLP
jgi:hypothetical protein